MMHARIGAPLKRFVGVHTKAFERSMASFAADKQAGVSGLRSAMTSPEEAAQLLACAVDPSSCPTTRCRVIDLDVANPQMPAQLLGGALCLPSDFHPILKGGPSGMHVIDAEEAMCITSELGLVPTAPVLLTDALGCMPTARMWWLLRAYGFPGAALLQCCKQDLWSEHGTNLKAEAARSASADELQAADAALQAAPLALSPQWVAYLPEVQAVAKGTPPAPSTILDVRSEAEFAGQDVRGGNPVGGHIPGARNIPHDLFLQPGAAWPATPHFKSPKEVQALLAEHGFPSPQEAGRVIVTCQSGMRASVPLPALYDLGYDVALYDGSMGEYSRDVHSVFA